MAELLIPDTNEFHPVLDAAQLGAWTPAVILRVCYGTGHLDASYARNVAAVRAVAAIRAVGHYCYLVAGQDPAAQGRQFATWIRAYGGPTRADFFACDDEEGAGDQAPRVAAFWDGVHAALGEAAARDFDYSGVYFWKTHLGAVPAGAHRWIAAYGQGDPNMAETLWQFTDSESVPGVSGLCDCSRFAGTVDEFLTIIGGPPPQPSEDDMPLNAADLAAVAKLIDDRIAGLETWLRQEFAASGDELHDRVVQASTQAIVAQLANIGAAAGKADQAVEHAEGS